MTLVALGELVWHYTPLHLVGAVSAGLFALSLFLIIEAARKVFMLPPKQLVRADQSLATDDDPADLGLPADLLAALPPIPSDDRDDHQREQD